MVFVGANVVALGCRFAFGIGFLGLSGFALFSRGCQLDMDWWSFFYSGNGEVTASLVFCGYGIEDKDCGYDDYAGVDVKGKIAVVFSRGLRSDKGGAFGAEHPTLVEDIRYKVSLARAHGAA